MWRNKAEELRFIENKSWTQISNEMSEFFPEMNSQQILEKVRRYLRSCDQYKEKKDGWMEKAEPKTITNKWTGDKIIRFGLLGDTQFSSKYTQITHLHKFYDILQQEGITNATIPEIWMKAKK